MAASHPSGPVVCPGGFVGPVVSTGNFTVSSAGAITAGTTQTRAGATAITGDIVVVTTANASDGVVLPAAVVGMRITVVNASANAGKIYAAGSDTVNGTAGSTGVALTASKTTTAIVVEAGKWLTSVSA